MKPSKDSIPRPLFMCTGCQTRDDPDYECHYAAELKWFRTGWYCEICLYEMDEDIETGPSLEEFLTGAAARLLRKK